MAKALMLAEFTGEPQLTRTKDAGGGDFEYVVRSNGAAVDNFQQPVDVFKLSKAEGCQSNGPDTMVVCTYRGKNSRYFDLVGLSTEILADESVEVNKFYFQGGELVFVEQKSAEGESQLKIKVARGGGMSRYADPLVLSAFQIGRDLSTTHMYRNLGDNHVQTHLLQILDPLTGSVQLFAVLQNGVIVTSEPFKITEAIKKIGSIVKDAA